MNSKDDRVSGINTWFIIEILSFYGYILSAIIFILTHSCKSSCGCKKPPDTEYEDDIEPMYKHDFVSYNRKDLDWAAFV